MRDIRHPLFEFMPYGAPELLSAGPRHLSRALVLSSTLLPIATLLIAWFLSVTVVRHIIDLGPGIVLDPPPIHDPTPPAKPPDVPPSPPQPPIDDGRFFPVDSALIVPPEEQEPPRLDDGTDRRDIVIGEREGNDDGTAGRDSGRGVEPEPIPGIEADVLPDVVREIKPVYPEIARQAGVEGDVFLEFVVGRDGRVSRVEVVRSVPMLDSAAVQALRAWVFTPALSNNRPVAVRMTIPIKFRLH